MVAVGSDITISIGGTDYSTDINSFIESGGDNEYTMVRAFGNNYEQVLVGKTNYKVNFSFKVETATLKTLYESTTPLQIIITVGSEQVINYYNMLPESLVYKPAVSDIAMGELVYSCPAYDKTNTRYNRVLG